MAMTPVMRVPNASAAMPKAGLSPSFAGSGNHWSYEKKFLEFCCSAGIDFQTRKNAIAAMMTRTRIPAAIVRVRNHRSPGRTDEPRIAEGGRGDFGGAGGPTPVVAILILPLVAPAPPHLVRC